MGEERLGQGRENVKEFLRGNPDVVLDLTNQIKAASPEFADRISFDGGESGNGVVHDDDEE
jgi:recombination protein RecA